jgi:hypothetical protein
MSAFHPLQTLAEPLDLTQAELSRLSADFLLKGRYDKGRATFVFWEWWMSGPTKWLPLVGIVIVVIGLFVIGHFVAKFW